MIDDLTSLDAGYLRGLEALASEPRQKGNLNKLRMQEVLLSLARDQYLTLSVFAALVQRNSDSLRQQYLSPMVKAGLLVMAFPSKPTHEKQAYRAASDTAEESTSLP